jgi:fructoselysine 6-kinase
MKAAVIGDNCIDFYKNLNQYYPTGNVINTGVHLKKLGIPTSVISTTGSDKYGSLMMKTLKSEGLDLKRMKIKEGNTAITYMDLKDGERIHGEYIEGVMKNIVFDEEDILYAAEHDLVHSAFWGKADQVLETIKDKGKENELKISFDYADSLESDIVKKTEKVVDYAFFSYKKRDKYIEDYLKEKVNKGIKIAIATFGENGSLAYDGERYYEFGIFPTKVENTIGAGDSFIAGFLYGIMNKKSIEKSLECGAHIASKVVGIFEPW